MVKLDFVLIIFFLLDFGIGGIGGGNIFFDLNFGGIVGGGEDGIICLLINDRFFLGLFIYVVVDFNFGLIVWYIGFGIIDWFVSEYNDDLFDKIFCLVFVIFVVKFFLLKWRFISFLSCVWNLFLFCIRSIGFKYVFELLLSFEFIVDWLL